MKGIILDCLKNLVSNKFGIDKWQNIVALSGGAATNQGFLATSDLDDKVAISLINSTCTVLNVSLEQAAEAFGEYWMVNYASKIYSAYIVNIKSSKDLLAKLDTIHSKATNNIPNANPPRFSYEWKNENTLIMTYNSTRNLIDLFVGLAKAVGKYYNDYPKITKNSNKQVQIIFA